MPTHRCPKAGCEEQVDIAMLACPPHWYLVPKPMRRAVWRAWRGGDGAGSPEHGAAIAAAIRAMNGGA